MVQTQQSFVTNPQLIQQVFNLLETSFPGITREKENCQSMGVRWESVSTPFVIFQEGVAVCHAGVLTFPLIIFNQSVTVAGIHAVCTHPNYRRRGFFHQIMGDVLDFCGTHYKTFILFTDKPDLYIPFGFRVVQEHRFKLMINDHKISGKPPKSLRLLDNKNPEDVYLIHELLDTRTPVSAVLGVSDEKVVFCFNEGARPLYYSQYLNLIVSMEIKGSVLHLYDVVGPQIFELQEILQFIPTIIKEVWVYFSPDKLGEKIQMSESYILDGDSVLMVKGPFSVEKSAFMVPRTSRF